ncbi:MAG TPA: (Fe-S)-binding protein [Dermatophilaceae bacterium]|nr:(Fe-S)-binding protein [Dermatophilaceae bacterium]
MRVALQVTCLNDALFPETGRAVVTLLERLGVTVEFPAGQTCCAQPMVNTGYLDEAVPVVENFVDAFAGYDAVVTPSGSCAASVRHQHGIVARRSGSVALQEAVATLAPRTYELTEFLVDVLGVEDVGAYFPHAVTYHPTCHSVRMAHVGDRPVRLLQAVRGLRLLDLPQAEECCGFGGTFAVKNADTSVAMGGDKARHVRDSGAEVLVAGDNSCLMHIGGLLTRQRSGMRVMHLAEVLAATDATAGRSPS